jgi:peptidyl-prolyl cis-trans isomerase D
MFEFVRKHTKIMMLLMFVVTIPAFLLVGVDSFTRGGGSGKTVATVGSHSITQSEWDAAHKREVDRMRASMPNLDPKLLESPEAQYVTLERLVRERVLSDAANGAHLVTTDARLASELQRNQTIASLRLPDGSFDKERYRQLAAAQGLTTDGFEARVRNDLTMQQLESGIVSTAFTTPAEVSVGLNAFFERREAQISLFNAADYASKVSPSDADIEAFYQSNSALFQAPETANVEYVVLDLDTVKKSISLNEQDVKTYYEQNATRLSGKEERRASHILIGAAKDLPAAERQKAKERAEALLIQVRKAPDTFADVARKNSQDTGSAAKGGDLDYFGRGAMVKPFENAVFAMKKGDISDLVESDFGYHIIKLTDVKTPKQRSFEELRPSIESDLKAQQAQGKFAEAAEAFTNGVYEQSDSLKPIAERLKLDVKAGLNIQRQNSPGGNPVLTNSKLLAAIFSADSVEKQRNTEVVEIAPNELAAARIIQHTAARTRPLPEVRDIVRSRLVASRAAELAKKDGSEKLIAWKAAAPANMPAVTMVSREQGQNIPGPILDAALRVDPEHLPAWAGVDLGAKGYAVVRVNKVLPRTPPAPDRAAQERKQFTQWIANAENQAYYNVLKDRYKAKIKVPRPERNTQEKQPVTE